MFPLVCVDAAVSEDVVTFTRLFAIQYNITTFASARLLVRVTLFMLSVIVVTQSAVSTVITLHEAGSLTLHTLLRSDVLLCGRIPYRRHIFHDWSDKRLLV